MIQTYLADSLVKNSRAPSYPIFIALQNYLNTISNKKSMREAKADILMVIYWSMIVGTKSRTRW